MLSLENISFSYDDMALLDNINLILEDNRIYGLIGKNGVGKTTLLKIMTRFINTNSGEILLNGISIANKDFLETNIAFVLDESIVLNELTFLEHLNLIAKSSQIPKKNYLEFTKAFIMELDLEKYKHSYPGTLSRGTLQRLNIGMGLIRHSPYLIMDEPFNGLDPVQTVKCLNFIKRYHQYLKNTIIISSHQLEYLKNVCDEYLIMTSKGILRLNKNQINETQIIEILNNDTIS